MEYCDLVRVCTGMVTYLNVDWWLVQQLRSTGGGVRVKDSHLTIVRMHLKRPAVIDDHWTKVSHRQVAFFFKVVEYAAKVDY